MLTKTLVAISAFALLVAAPGLSSAKSITNMVKPSSLASYCEKAGAGTETTATVELPDGTKVTGTIHCEAEDVAAGTDTSSSASQSGEDDSSMSEPEDDNSSSVEPGDDNDGASDVENSQDSSAQSNDDGPGHDANDDHGGDSDHQSGGSHDNGDDN